MKKLLLLFTLGLLLAPSIQAQKMNADANDFADLFKRQLHVEFADTLEVGRDQLTVYPQKNLGYMIKSAVEEYWKLNSKIEFETQSDIKRNLDRGEGRSAYLFLTKHPDSKAGSMIWILNYSKGTTYKEGKTDYQIYLPDISKRGIKEFTLFDIQFTINVMQEHIKNVQKSGKEITPIEYFYIDAKKNCKVIKDSNPNVLIDQGNLSKSVDEKVLRKSFRRVNHSLVTSAQLNSILEQNKDTCAVILVYPGHFESLSNSAMGEKYIFWNKILVQGSNFKILGVVGDGRKDNVLIGIEGDDITTLVDCD